MNDDKIQGTARMIGGKLEDVVGGLTGDTKTQAQGKVDQLTGKAQQVLGGAKDAVASVAGETASTVSGVADRVATAASDLDHNAYEKSADVAHKVGEVVRESPFTVMIAAGMLGLVVGYLLGRPTYERVVQAGPARLSYRDR